MTDSNSRQRRKPASNVHPGEIVRLELMQRGIKQKHFAKAIEMPIGQFKAFLRGNYDVDNNLAVKLEKHLNIPRGFWIGMQEDYNEFSYQANINF
jgi:HTH-type transcriptional regulator/antitoxin HigA